MPMAARAQAAPPPGMAAVENARSRICVAKIAKIAELNDKAAPYMNRARRIRALAEVVALEDTTQAAPFDTRNALERAVHAWYTADHALALRIVAGDSSLVSKRDTARAVIERRIQSAMDSVTAQAKSKLAGADSTQAEAQPCQGAIFVRPVVLQACKAIPGSPLCAAARRKPDTIPSDTAQFRFVNAANDLWGIEQLRPWTDPAPLQAGPGGSLIGGRTMARARRGNIIVAVALAPLFKDRSKMDSTQVAQFQANLDSLGFTFSHPRYVMAPSLELEASVPPPIGGENLYILHFGTLAKPAIIWSIKAGKGGLIQATFPATAKLLDRLKAGDVLSFTALKVPKGSTQGTPVYSISLLNVNEARAATQLLGYMKSGDMSKDLNKLVPGGKSSAGG